MLSKEESKDFLNSILGIDDCFKKFEQNKVQLLSDIAYSFMHAIPFQTVHAINVPPDARHVPTFDEIKSSMMTRQGGSCYSMNYFLREVLVSIGYQVDYTGTLAFGIDNFHLTLIIRSLVQFGDSHFLDISTSLPTWRVIPLDFNEASPVYKQGFLEYKLSRKDNNTISLFTKRNYPENTDKEKDKWYLFYDICLTPCTIDDFTANLQSLYVDPYYCKFPFLLQVRAVIMSNERLVAIKDKEFIYENDKDELVTKPILTNDELRSILLKYFPQMYKFNSNIVELINIEN